MSAYTWRQVAAVWFSAGIIVGSILAFASCAPPDDLSRHVSLRTAGDE